LVGKPPSCTRHLVHVSYLLPEMDRKATLGRLKKVEGQRTLGRGIQVMWMHGLARKPRGRSRGFVIHAEIRARPNVLEKALLSALRDVQDSVESIVGPTRPTSFQGDAWTEFAFGARKYVIVSGARLPVRFSLDPDLTKKVGRAELSAIGLAFRHSPIGVESIEIQVHEGTLYVRVMTVFKSSRLGRVVQHTYNRAKEISGLFVRAA